MKNAIIVGVCIIIASITVAFIVAPKPTADQIAAQSKAQLDAKAEVQREWDAQQKAIDAREAAKSDTQKAAETVSGAVEGATATYVGLQLIKHFF